MDAYTSQEVRRLNDRIDALVGRVQMLEEIVKLLRDNQTELMEAQRETLRIMRRLAEGRKVTA